MDHVPCSGKLAKSHDITLKSPGNRATAEPFPRWACVMHETVTFGVPNVSVRTETSKTHDYQKQHLIGK